MTVTALNRHWQDYQDWAESYDADVDGHTRYRAHIVVAEKISPFLPKHRPVHIVDLGTGTGRVIDLLRRDFPRAHIDGYDYSPAMIEQCAAKNIADSLTLCDLEMPEWPIRPRSADAVTAAAVLDVIGNTDLFLNNTRAVMKDGAVAALTYEVQELHKKGMGFARSTVQHDPDDIISRAEKTGFTVLDHEVFLGYYSYGRRIDYGVLVLQNPTP